ncbi:MAG: YfiR family protein [Steroidobacteraceae bacterium]
MRTAPLRIFALALLAACASLQVGSAQPTVPLPVSELSIKAAYLYKFAGYVEWPPDAQSDTLEPFVIGVLASDTFADELAKITAGRTINNRPISVRRIKADEPLGGVEILFVAEHDRNRLDQLLVPARQLPILTVTETVGAISAGSIINFTTEKQRVRFEVSLAAAEHSRLKLSSRLLAVAARVHRTTE